MLIDKVVGVILVTTDRAVGLRLGLCFHFLPFSSAPSQLWYFLARGMIVEKEGRKDKVVCVYFSLCGSSLFKSPPGANGRRRLEEPNWVIRGKRDDMLYSIQYPLLFRLPP